MFKTVLSFVAIALFAATVYSAEADLTGDVLSWLDDSEPAMLQRWLMDISLGDMPPEGEPLKSENGVETYIVNGETNQAEVTVVDGMVARIMVRGQVLGAGVRSRLDEDRLAESLGNPVEDKATAFVFEDDFTRIEVWGVRSSWKITIEDKNLAEKLK